MQGHIRRWQRGDRGSLLASVVATDVAAGDVGHASVGPDHLGLPPRVAGPSDASGSLGVLLSPHFFGHSFCAQFPGGGQVMLTHDDYPVLARIFGAGGFTMGA